MNKTILSDKAHLYSFISYTTREDEIKEIKPFIDEYLARMRNRLPFFYDGVHIPQKYFSKPELMKILKQAIYSCDFTTAFTSPSYFDSEWCQFEWMTYLHKENEKGCNWILNIAWKRHSGILPRQYFVPIYNEIESGAFNSALDKAVYETIHFMESFCGIVI